MRVTLPDDLADVYQAYATQQGISLDALLTTQLRRFKALIPGHRAVVIDAKALRDLEGVLGGTPILDGEDLVKRARAHASIRLNGVDLRFTPSQKREIVHRAERQGKTPEHLAEEIVAYVRDQAFWQSGGGEAAAPTRKAG